MGRTGCLLGGERFRGGGERLAVMGLLSLLRNVWMTFVCCGS